MNGFNSGVWLNGFRKAVDGVQYKVNKKVVSLGQGLDYFGALLKDVKKKRRSVWWVGNGGSAAICAHLSQDLVNKLKIKSALFQDGPLLTCMSNDYGYEFAYLKPLMTVADRHDLLVAISSSGRSLNIIRCADFALKNNLKLVTCSGFEDDNQLWRMPANLSIYVPSQIYGHVEIAHEMLLHSAIETLSFQGKKIFRHKKSSDI